MEIGVQCLPVTEHITLVPRHRDKEREISAPGAAGLREPALWW